MRNLSTKWVVLVLASLWAVSAAQAQQRVQGMDVSQFQGTMNWNTAYAAGARFAFVRAGRGGTTSAEGKQDDTTFLTNMIGAANAGVITGTYLRARPDLSELPDNNPGTSDDQPTTVSLKSHADDEAQNLYNLVHAYLTPTHLRPVLDLENIPSDVPQHAGTEPLSKASMTTWANEFLDHFEALSGGVEPIVYVNTDYATSRLTSGINSPSRRTLWIARPYSSTYTNSSQPETPSGYANPYGVWNNPANPNSSWDFWQYDSTGNGATYGASSANLDLDTFNGDMNALRAFMVPEPGAGLLAVAACVIAVRRRRPTGRTVSVV